MKDKELKLEDVKAPHTLGSSSYKLLLYIDSTEEVVRLFEVELQKPRNLSTHESEECEYGEGGCVYATLMVSDTLHPYVRAEEDKRPGRARKKPNDLSACESEERGMVVVGQYFF